MHRIPRFVLIAAALLLVIAFVTSCGGDPHDQRFHNYYPAPMATGTIIGVTPTPVETATATP